MSQEIRSTHITRRRLLRAAALAPAPFGILRARARESRPNILFLMDDQHRGDCLGADGNRAIHTPNLDRIAREGIRFSSAYTATPSCTPARSALLTGLAPWNHGMLGYGRVAGRYPLEMPRALAEAGYYAMAIGKLHYAPQRNLHGYHAALLDESSRVESPDFRSDYRAWFWSEAPGLDPDATGIGFNDYRGRAYVLPERLHPTHWMGQCAVRFLEQYNRPQPFFLKVSFARPHSPYDPPDRWFKHYAEADIPKPHAGRWAEPYRRRSDPGNNIWHGDMGAETAISRRCYYGSVSFIDEQVGRILEALDRRGWLENTVILYTSDHGDMTGDHHLWRKTYAYEGSARIPMLLRLPKGLAAGPRGAAAPQPVELRDILPTFLDARDRRPQPARARARQDGWLARGARPGALRGVFGRKPVDRADRRTVEVHLPRLPRQRAIVRPSIRPPRTRRPLGLARARGRTAPVAVPDGGAPGAPGRALHPRRQAGDPPRADAVFAELPEGVDRQAPADAAVALLAADVALDLLDDPLAVLA